MRYFIEDTKDGFRLGAVLPSGKEVSVEEKSSHGMFADNYRRTARLFDALRSEMKPSGRNNG